MAVSSAASKGECMDWKEAMKQGLGLTIPKGTIVILTSLIVSAEQALLGPFRVFTLFSLMAVVLIVNDKKSTMNAIKSALLFRYSAPSQGGGLAAAFVLVGLGVLLFAGEYSLSIIYKFLLYGDELLNIPRDPWTVPFPGMPFSVMYFVANLVYAFGVTSMISMTACYHVSLYFSVRSKINYSA